MMELSKNKIFLILSILTGVLLLIFLALEGTGYYLLYKQKASLVKGPVNDANLDADALKALEAKNEKLLKKIKKLAPAGAYIVIDTAHNILYLREEDQLLRKAVIATGNGNVLTEPGGKNRVWTFDTPKGEFAVKNKKTDPTWKMPDWAFIEEGEEIPKNVNDRIQEDVLGDYALGIGNEYYIHGTLYTRTLGMHVSHGCIRVGDEDLEVVNKAAKIGTKVYIY